MVTVVPVWFDSDPVPIGMQPPTLVQIDPSGQHPSPQQNVSLHHSRYFEDSKDSGQLESTCATHVILAI
jgi:hypothetical protein